jgi:alkanesulfonate monooxygenase SsuD/methylene tetrahydromethanopterin reductase-like flavin-dependent oxidoreductase (luciferase family)
MHVDIALEPGHSAAELVELGRLAEEAGIATLWITHDPQERDVFLLFGEVARATRRLRLGVMAISPFELHPLRLSSALLTLGEISGGRVSVVVGAGGAILAHSRIDLSRRVRTVRECVDILQDAGPERALDYDGEIFNVQSYRPAWAVQPRPRVLVGANREQMLRMSARRADGVLFSDMPLQRIDQAVRTVEQALAARGRPKTGFEINNYWAFHVKPDRARALAEARSRLVLRGMLSPFYISPFLTEDEVRQVTGYMPSFYRALARRSGVIEGVPETIISALLDNLTLTASVTELDTRLEVFERFARAGVTHISLGLHDDAADAIRLIGARVVPALAAL